MFSARGKLISLIGMFSAILAVVVGCQAASASPQIEVEEAWGRPSPQMATAGAFYMVIRNTGGEADRLLSAESPACGVTELHESFMNDEGAMGMRPVEGGAIEIPAKGEVELKVGGMHVMCIDRQEDFELGAVMPLTLHFEKSGDMTVNIEIREP